MTYHTPDRNFSGVQFADLRQQVDHKYNAVHDELSEAYYSGAAFRNYGVLDKATFDKLHALIFHLRHCSFHESNQNLAEPYATSTYNQVIDSEGNVVVESIHNECIALINDLANEGIVLIISS